MQLIHIYTYIYAYIHISMYTYTYTKLDFVFFQTLFMWGMSFVKMVSVLMNFIENKHQTVINYM